MNEPYPNIFLNATLARWVRRLPETAPRVDCAACARPSKCCAFQPFVPNFLLGRALSEGRDGAALMASSGSQVRWLAIGAVAAVDYRQRFDETPGADRGVDLLCAFFDRSARGCRIWSIRPGECSTYFCDDRRDEDERRQLSARAFAIESAVAQMALVELGLSPREIDHQVEALNGGPAPETAGVDLASMYKKAWIWSQQLTSETIASWIGPE